MEDIKSIYNIDNILKFFSLFYIIFITCGFTYNYFFYKSFGINITEYIDISEAFLMFLPLLANTFILLSILLIAWYFMNKTFIFSNTENQNILFQRKEMKRAMRGVIYILITFLLIFIILNFFSLISNYTLYFFLALVVCFILPYLLELVFRTFYNAFGSIIPELFRDVIYIFIICLAIVLWMSYSQSERVLRKSGYKKFDISFKNNEKPLVSDSNLYYLGRTKNYLFIYEFSLKRTTIWNISDIKQIRFSN